MATIIDACIECKHEVFYIESEPELILCIGCESYIHPHQVVKRYV